MLPLESKEEKRTAVLAIKGFAEMGKVDDSMVDSSVDVFLKVLEGASDDDAKDVFKTAVGLLTSNKANSDD